MKIQKGNNKMFKKENIKLTITLTITLITTTIMYILVAIGAYETTKMPWYMTLIGTTNLIASYAFLYELGKHKKEKTDELH